MVPKEHDGSAGAVPVVIQTLQVNNLRKVGILVVMNTVALVQAFDATCICVTLPVSPSVVSEPLLTFLGSRKRARCLVFRKSEHGLSLSPRNSHIPTHLCRTRPCHRSKTSIHCLPNYLHIGNDSLRRRSKQSDAPDRPGSTRSRLWGSTSIVRHDIG